MNTNNTHSKYKSQLSIQLPSSSIERHDTPTRYLFQGKLLKATLDKKRGCLSLLVTMPLSVNRWPVDSRKLFEEVTVDIYFYTLLIGLMNNDTLEVKLEDNEHVLLAFSQRVFRGDFGAPDQHGVDDLELPQMVNVHFRKSHYELPYEVIEFVIPTMNNEMPFIKVVFKHLEISRSNGEKVKRREAEAIMAPFYEDNFVNEKDRLKIEWQELYGIKNSFDFYNNRLQNWYWFQYQFHPQREQAPAVKKSLGDMLRPLWVECSDVKVDDYGSIEHLVIQGATRNWKKANLNPNEVWWLPPDNYAALLTFLSNELVNSDSENPFSRIIELYISKWEPNDTVDCCLPYDLRRVIDVDPVLSKHLDKSNFFSQLDYWAKERGLVWV